MGIPVLWSSRHARRVKSHGATKEEEGHAGPVRWATYRRATSTSSKVSILQGSTVTGSFNVPGRSRCNRSSRIGSSNRSRVAEAPRRAAALLDGTSGVVRLLPNRLEWISDVAAKARAQVTALTCVTLASACSFSSLSPSRPLLSPSARAVQAATRCSARAQLTALTVVLLASAAASALASAPSLHPGCCFYPLLGQRRPHRAARRARTADCPQGREARRRHRLQLSLHPSQCSRPQLKRRGSHRADSARAHS